MIDNKILPISYELIIRKMWGVALVKAKVLITWNKELRRFQISSNKEVTIATPRSVGGLRRRSVLYPVYLFIFFFPFCCFCVTFDKMELSRGNFPCWQRANASTWLYGQVDDCAVSPHNVLSSQISWEHQGKVVGGSAYTAGPRAAAAAAISTRPLASSITCLS